MDMDTKEQIFRKESLDRISSPEQLNDYLKVTNPGVWAVLAAVIFFIVGILIWSVFGRLTTTVTLDGKAEDGIITVACTSEQAKNLEPGMKEKIWDEESTILSVSEPGNGGMVTVTLKTSLPDGTYPVEVVTESIKPLSFLFS